MRVVAAPHHASGVERVGAVRLRGPARVEAELAPPRRAPSGTPARRPRAPVPDHVSEFHDAHRSLTTRDVARRRHRRRASASTGSRRRPARPRVLVVRHGESAPEHPGQAVPAARRARRPRAPPARRAPGASCSPSGCSTSRSTRSTSRRCGARTRPRRRSPARLGLTPIEEPDLREVFLGEWEGGVFRSTRGRQRPDLPARSSAEERWDVIPGAEPHDDFDARVWRGFQRIVAAHPDQTRRWSSRTAA